MSRFGLALCVLGAELFHRRGRRVEPSALKDLSGQLLLMREPGRRPARHLKMRCRSTAWPFRSPWRPAGREALREAVARGLGIGTVPESEYVPDPSSRPSKLHWFPAP
jgi:LysR family transcriptional regulator, low CO2-responsive transcriptional regulator